MYYLAKANIIMSIKRESDVASLASFINALDSYNQYLRTNLKITIANIQTVYFDMLCELPQIQKEKRILFSKVFNGDKLAPLREIREIMEAKDKEGFLLTRHKFEMDSKSLLPIIASLIPIIYALVRAILGS